jgi:hypothetical protein
MSRPLCLHRALYHQRLAWRIGDSGLVIDRRPLSPRWRLQALDHQAAIWRTAVGLAGAEFVSRREALAVVSALAAATPLPQSQPERLIKQHPGLWVTADGHYAIRRFEGGYMMLAYSRPARARAAAQGLARRRSTSTQRTLREIARQLAGWRREMGF